MMPRQSLEYVSAFNGSSDSTENNLVYRTVLIFTKKEVFFEENRNKLTNDEIVSV